MKNGKGVKDEDDDKKDNLGEVRDNCLGSILVFFFSHKSKKLISGRKIKIGEEEKMDSRDCVCDAKAETRMMKPANKTSQTAICKPQPKPSSSSL